jgi:Arc/MetJ-type ribon-helix-helix transcriptional regulator
MAEVDKSEKITINIGLVDLGQIDLLVDEGFYANRTDFIRTAIRRQLEGRAAAVNSTVERRALTLGTQHLSRQELEALQDAGRQIELRVLGLATIADDVSPELALATIASVEVLGAFRASRAPRSLPRSPATPPDTGPSPRRSWSSSASTSGRCCATGGGIAAGSPAPSLRCRSAVASTSFPARMSRSASGMPVARSSSMGVPLPGNRGTAAPRC